MSGLVPSPQSPDETLDALGARVTELDAALNERARELARTKSELGAFKARYRREVGELHEELEELERQIAELELGEINRRLADDEARGAQGEGAMADSAPKLTSDAVRRLFRDVARIIHPDLASDELTRDRRHALMIEANKAYALGDEERLRWILQAWERSPEAVQGSDEESTRLRLERRITQLEEQLEIFAGELNELKASSIWKLKAMVDESAGKGKDLVADTVRRLKRDILVARNRLDAMRASS